MVAAIWWYSPILYVFRYYFVIVVINFIINIPQLTVLLWVSHDTA